MYLASVRDCPNLRVWMDVDGRRRGPSPGTHAFRHVSNSPVKRKNNVEMQKKKGLGNPNFIIEESILLQHTLVASAWPVTIGYQECTHRMC